jgi:hypothetical protein
MEFVNNKTVLHAERNRLLNFPIFSDGNERKKPYKMFMARFW